MIETVCKHGVLKTIACSRCAAEKAKALKESPPAAASEMTYTRIVLKNGQGFVDVPHQKSSFVLAPYVNLVKGCGGVMTERVHIPWENILAIFVFENEAQLDEMPLAGPTRKNDVN
jgi:hypothetical protein